MSNYLCIRINDEYLKPWSIAPWSVVDVDSQIVSSGNSLVKNLISEVPEFDASMRCVLVVPGTFVLTKTVSLPKAQQSHIKQVLPFLVEEHLIDPIENTHLAAAPLLTNETVTVACVKRSYMSHWLETLQGAEIHPDYMYADYMCLPSLQDSSMSMLVEQASVLICSSDQVGLVLPADSIESMMKVVLNNLDSEQAQNQVNLYGAKAEDEELFSTLQNESQLLQRHLANDAALLDEFDESRGDNHGSEGAEISADVANSAKFDAETLSDSARISEKPLIENIKQLVQSENISAHTEHLAETASQVLFISSVQRLDRGINLLQGDFKAVSANAENKRFLKRVAVGVAACLAVFLVTTLVGGWYLQNSAKSYRDDSVAIYRSLFPKQRRVYDPVKQLKSQIKRGSFVGVRSEFLPLLDAASKSLSALHQSDEAESNITQLRYDMQRGQISIDITAENIDQLETYRDLLVKEGFVVDILSANRNGDVISGRIQIGRA